RAGRGLIAGEQPLTHYPPLYPVLLAAVAVLCRCDILVAARLVSAVCYGGNLLLIGWAIHRVTAGSLPAMGLGVCALLASDAFLSLHLMAWSEPPFLLFLLGGLHGLARYVASPRWPVLLAASLCLAVALLTRYAGVALLPPLVLAVLLGGDRARHGTMR